MRIHRAVLFRETAMAQEESNLTSLLPGAVAILLAIFGAALCIDMAVNRHLNNLMLLVAISLIGFVGSVTVARFVAERREGVRES